MSSESTFSGDGLWLFAILALFGFGGNGFFGNGRNNDHYATSADVQRSTDFAALERQNGEIMQNASSIGNSINAAIRDGNYNLLSEIRDVESVARNGFAEAQKGLCETLRAVDSVKYEGAINTAAINANTTTQVQRVLDALATNRMAEMQSKINHLELKDAVAGLVRNPIPAYLVGNGGNCNYSNI